MEGHLASKMSCQKSTAYHYLTSLHKKQRYLKEIILNNTFILKCCSILLNLNKLKDYLIILRVKEFISS